MGSNTSKSSTETGAVSQKNDNDKDVSSNSDPRSPTPEITRTPLQNKNGAKHNITKNMDLRKTFESEKIEEKIIHNNPILSAVIKNHLQSYDPRSPSQDFERTPIIISTNIDEESGARLKIEDNCGSPCLKNDTIENNNYDTSFEAKEISPDIVVPKNLFNKFHDMTLNDSLKESEEPLGSSTASNEVIQNDISIESCKPTKLLETNFDYVENELDKLESHNEPTSKINNNTNHSTENFDFDIKNIPLYMILKEDPRSPSTGIDRTPIVVAKTDVSDGNVEEMSDDSLIKALQNTNSEFHKNICQDKNTEEILIYEDEKNTLNDTPTKSKSNSGSRTPLSCMKNKTDASHARSKSTNTLIDAKSNNKLQRRVSHIPRLKSLAKQPRYTYSGSSVSLKNIIKPSATSGDCENTPPHSHRDRWDKDSSIVL